jgi:hypothetical protein
MNQTLKKQLALHGAIVLLGAFVAGYMLAEAISGDMPGKKADWNLAHMECLVNGLLLFGVAGISGALTLGAGQARVMTWCFIGMAYCNLVFGFMRGATGASGLSFDGPLTNQVSTAFGTLGVPLGFIGLVLVILGALKKA